jgi:cytochrome c oxidase cbb3-type subunit 3
MKKPHIYFLVIGILVCVVIISFLTHPDPLLANRNKNQSADKTPSADLVKDGTALYEKYCSMCHASNGNGYLADEASALSNQDFLKSASNDYILQAILRGRPGTPMSAWGLDKGGALNQADAAAILSFIRSWQKEPSVELSTKPIKGDAENGANVYQQWCAACHGKYGTKGKYTKLDNPIFHQTASDGFIRYTIENGRRNTPMTAYKNKLTALEIDDVISYIRTLIPKEPFKETVALVNKELSEMIREKGVLNPGNPPADFTPIDDKYVPVDDVFAAYEQLKSFIIIDARPQSDYIRSHIKGAISIPFYDIKDAVGLLPKDVWIITYCVCPHALSGKAADKLKAADYHKVAILDEGFFDWQKKGYPSESKINSNLSYPPD